MAQTTFLTYLNPKFLLPTIFNEVSTLLVGSVVLCFYLVLITSAIPMYLYRFILSKLTKYFKPSLGEMLTSRGQCLALENFTSIKATPRSNVVVSLAYEGDLTLDQVRVRLLCKLIDKKDERGNLKYPEATQYVTSYMGFKYWKPDPRFSLKNHVRLYQPAESPSSANESFPFTQVELRDLMELLLNQPFQPERSPWEMLLVNNYINLDMFPGKMSLVILKFHHCIADGYGAMNTFITALSDQKPVVPEPRYAKRRNLRLLMFQLTYPIRLLRDLSQFIVMSLGDHPWKLGDEQKAWKLFYQNSPIIPMEHVKEVKNRFGVSFAAVIHSCLGSAIGKCLLAKYGIEQASKLTKMPCVAPLPLPGHPLKFRNYCTAVMIHLPTQNMDPIDRLRKCDNDLINIKKSTMPMIGKYLPVVGGSMIESLAGIIGRNRYFPVSISNFPISEYPFEMDGKKNVNIQGVAGGGAGVCGIAICVYSYVDGIQISVSGEKGLFSREELDLIIQGTIDELYNLYTHRLT